MPAQSGGSFAGRVPRATLHPLSIAFAIVTIAAAMIAPILALPAAGAWIASVVVIAARRGAGERLPDISHLPPSIQADLAGVTAALDRLRDAARAVPADQRPLFEGIQREADEVRESVLQLAIAAGALHRHLETMRPEQVEADLAALRARLETTGDEAARRQIEASIADNERRIERRQALLARLERYRATIKSLESTAAEVADRAVDLAAGAPMEYDAFDDRSPERKVSEMKASVAALEEVLRTDTETI